MVDLDGQHALGGGSVISRCAYRAKEIHSIRFIILTFTAFALAGVLICPAKAECNEDGIAGTCNDEAMKFRVFALEKRVIELERLALVEKTDSQKLKMPNIPIVNRALIAFCVIRTS